MLNSKTHYEVWILAYQVWTIARMSAHLPKMKISYLLNPPRTSSSFPRGLELSREHTQALFRCPTCDQMYTLRENLNKHVSSTQYYSAGNNQLTFGHRSRVNTRKRGRMYVPYVRRDSLFPTVLDVTSIWCTPYVPRTYHLLLLTFSDSVTYVAWSSLSMPRMYCNVQTTIPSRKACQRTAQNLKSTLSYDARYAVFTLSSPFHAVCR